jgi:hypothetical protein
MADRQNMANVMRKGIKRKENLKRTFWLDLAPGRELEYTSCATTLGCTCCCP